ncbi:hypothetical protein HHK36_025866 [Tetracentron sinense]|uniref:Uncharacterized protein n=1 Tax=Tetracentron sinense TaxID=13715 RepID=A0A835D3I4_TETSI|nr:hypothetical protein HHK36_025866 [Tetracentron sinense]
MAFNNHLSHDMSLHHLSISPEQLPQSSPDGAGKQTAGKSPQQQPPELGGGGRTWLNNAILQQQNQWLHPNSDDDVPVSGSSMIATAIAQSSADLNDSRKSGNNQKPQIVRYKEDILKHPLYNRLLSAHVSCLRIATPVDQLPRIDVQLEQSQQVVAKYSVLGYADQPLVGDDKDLEQFMELHSYQTHYILLLCSFKEQLQQHVRVHAMEAVMACWQLEQSLQSLTGEAQPTLFQLTHLGFVVNHAMMVMEGGHHVVTIVKEGVQFWFNDSPEMKRGMGDSLYVELLSIIASHAAPTGVSPGEGMGATMSDDDDDQVDSDTNLCDESLEGPDTMGFGPIMPTESERSLMERVRQELKHELKRGYKEKIVDIREEILRKRRAGKLPGDTTSLLKSWWQSHSKWPYPTEEDKERLVQETGLQLKQINNWFINKRKRDWNSNPSSSTVSKSKRKRSNAGEDSGEHFM